MRENPATIERSEAIVADVLQLLHARGFVPSISEGDGKFIRIRWVDAGRRFKLVIPRSSDSDFARQASRETLQRLLRRTP
jgi:hypothetical protein